MFSDVEIRELCEKHGWLYEPPQARLKDLATISGHRDDNGHHFQVSFNPAKGIIAHGFPVAQNRNRMYVIDKLIEAQLEKMGVVALARDEFEAELEKREYFSKALDDFAKAFEMRAVTATNLKQIYMVPALDGKVGMDHLHEVTGPLDHYYAITQPPPRTW
jgi:hypothetical protein